MGNEPKKNLNKPPSRGLHKKNLRRLADSIVVGSVFALFCNTVLNSPQGTSPVDYKTKFPLNNTELNISAKSAGKTVLLTKASENYTPVKYNVDTVVIDTAYLKRAFHTFGGYVSEVKAISLKHFVVDTTGMSPTQQKAQKLFAQKFNNKKRIKSTIIHEVTHSFNDEIGLKAFGIGVFQFAKICCHDEISATISQLLDFRQQYLETNDLSVFKGNFKFYTDAIKEGRIKPDITQIPTSTELALIMNGSKKHWQETLQNYYEKAHMQMTKTWYNKSFFYRLRERVEGKNITRKHNEEYLKRLNLCYSFNIPIKDKDGIYKSVNVNFVKFMDQDIDISDNFKENLRNLCKTSFREGYQLYKKALKATEYVQAAEARKVKGEDTIIIPQRNAHFIKQKSR